MLLSSINKPKRKSKIRWKWQKCSNTKGKSNFMKARSALLVYVYLLRCISFTNLERNLPHLLWVFSFFQQYLEKHAETQSRNSKIIKMIVILYSLKLILLTKRIIVYFQNKIKQPRSFVLAFFKQFWSFQFFLFFVYINLDRAIILTFQLQRQNI